MRCNTSCVYSRYTLGSGRLPNCLHASEHFVYDDRCLMLSFFYIRYCVRAQVNYFRFGGFFCCMYDFRHTRDPDSLSLLLSDIYFRAGFRCLSNRFSKDVNHFTINDFVEAEPTNAFAEAVGGESIHPSIEGSGNQVVIDLLVSLLRVRTILQPIHRIGELSELGVCDCQFDFL